MQNRLSVFRAGISEDRRLFTELIEGLWERASGAFSNSPSDSCGSEWAELAEGAAAALAELVGWDEQDTSGEAGEAAPKWWEKITRAGYRVVVGEREVTPSGRRGVAALETAFLFAALSRISGDGENQGLMIDWQSGSPAVSGELPGGGNAVLAASRRGGDGGGLGMAVGVASRAAMAKKAEVVIEAILPTTGNRVLAVRLESPKGRK
jgi:hypothetical protein